jgi:hypothetical protein
VHDSHTSHPNHRSRDQFERDYAAALQTHVQSPSESGLAASYELGRRALSHDISLLELVALHHAIRQTSIETAPEAVTAADAFIGEALAAFEITQRGYAEAQLSARAERERAHILGELQRLASDLARAATRRRVAEALLRSLMASTGAAEGCVAMVGGRPPTLDVLARRGRPRAYPFEDLPAETIAVLAEAGERVELLAEPGDRLSAEETLPLHHLAALGVYPIVRSGGAHAVVLLGWATAGALNSLDRELMTAQALMAGPALRRASQFDVEREIAETLQRSLLLTPTLERPSFEWTVEYRASRHLAGGDWYDVIELDSGRVGLAMGDIVGRGVDAAAAMGQLRSATRALAGTLDDAAQVVRALERFALSTHQGLFSTVAYMTLDESTGEVTHSVAGHPPPAVILPNGAVELLWTGRGPLLGVDVPRTSATTVLEPGSRLVLYTDGLVERRGESMEEGLARFAERLEELAKSASTIHELCTHLVDTLSPPASRTDDIAVMGLLYKGPQPGRV